MFRVIVASLAIFTAYKMGENKARLEQLDFFLTKVTSIASGGNLIEYAVVAANGTLDFREDINEGTVLNYWDAMSLRGMFKKFAPTANVQIESVSSLITA